MAHDGQILISKESSDWKVFCLLNSLSTFRLRTFDLDFDWEAEMYITETGTKAVKCGDALKPTSCSIVTSTGVKECSAS